MFELLVLSAALAQVDGEAAAQWRDAKDFYGCVRALRTLARRSDDIAPLRGNGAGGCRSVLQPDLPQRTIEFLSAH